MPSIRVRKAPGFIFFYFLLHAMLFSGNYVKAQAITENFESWTVGSAVATSSTQAGATVPGPNSTAGWTYSTLIVSSNTGTITSDAKSGKAIKFSGSSGSFIATPLFSGGVVTVTLSIYPNGPGAKMLLGFATTSGPTTNIAQLSGSTWSNSTALSSISGAWTYTVYSASGGTYTTAATGATSTVTVGNIVTGQWNTVTYTTSIGTDKSVYMKMQRNASGQVVIDDIVLTAPTIAPPATQAKSVNFTGVGPASMDVNWTRGNGEKVAVFMKEGTGAVTNPSDASTYIASADWNTKGTQLGTSGYYCIYNGTAATVNVSNLLPSTNYTVQAFEYNGAGASTLYNVSTDVNNPNSQTTGAAVPTIQATPSSLPFDGVKTGTTKDLSYSLSAVYLSPASGNITVTAPAGYQVSLTAGSFSTNSITVPYTGSTLASTPIYVRFSPVALTAYNGNITNAGGGATTQNVAVTGTGVLFNIGDYMSKATGNWGAAATWNKWDGNAWVASADFPNSSTVDVYIAGGFTVNAETSARNCNDLFIEGNSILKSSNLVNSPVYLKLYGNVVHVEPGSLIGNLNTGNNADGISFDVFTDNLKIEGGGTINVSRIRTNTASTTLVFDNDVTINYHGSGNAGNAAGYFIQAGDNNITTVNAGKTVTFAPWSCMAISSSAHTSGANSLTMNINGTMTFVDGLVPGNATANGWAGHTNNYMSLGVATGKSFNLNIGPAGTLNVSELYPQGTKADNTPGSGDLVNISVAAGGALNVSQIADFRNAGQIVTGAGGFHLLSGATMKIGSVDGISASGATGPIQTTTRSFSTGANYEYAGTAAQATGSGLTGANKLTITNAAGVAVSGPTAVTNTLAFGNVSNSTLTTGGNLTLRSSASGTARIADLTNNGVNTGNAIAGNVTVERYIPADGRRAWRLLGANVSAVGAPTINTAWQEGGALTTTGTHITQAGGGGANGFDASTVAGASSIRYWNGTTLLTPANTNVTRITDNGGAYFLFVRGNRTINLNNASATSNTTLRQTGIVNQGTVVTNAIGGAFTLIPNPYASPVDYETIVTTSPNDVNLPTGQYYIWDANLGSVGGYRTIQRGALYTSTPSTGNATTDNEMRYISSGQAFFIPVNSQVTFTEAMKTDMVPTTNVYRAGTNTEEITIDLKVVGTGGTATLYDGVRAQYNNSFSAAVTAADAPKLNNFNENLAIVRENKTLAVEQRPLVDAADTIFLKLWNTGTKNYRFDINAINFSTTAGLAAYLVDNFLNTTTPVSLSANTMYDFSVTGNAASAAENRFMIVYKASTPLPVNFTNVKAYQKNSGIQVEWNVGAEQDVVKYEVEKSTNGTSFDKVNTTVAINNKAYAWFDANPVQGSNFYRIKVINKDNSYQYSQVVNVKIENTNGDIAVYPNPVKGGVINLQFTNLEKGTYTVQLTNSLGQQVYSGRIVHNGGSATESLQAGLTKGVYQMTLTNGTTKTTLQVVAE